MASWDGASGVHSQFALMRLRATQLLVESATKSTGANRRRMRRLKGVVSRRAWDAASSTPTPSRRATGRGAYRGLPHRFASSGCRQTGEQVAISKEGNPAGRGSGTFGAIFPTVVIQPSRV